MSARKPEATFRDSVHRYFPSRDDFHRQPMGAANFNGTPDFYYDGERRDLWVEWKFIQKFTKKGFWLHRHSGSPKLSTLQYEWLKRRHVNGENAYVIIGHKDGGVVWQFPQVDKVLITEEYFYDAMMTRKQLADWIMQYCDNLVFLRC